MVLCLPPLLRCVRHFEPPSPALDVYTSAVVRTRLAILLEGQLQAFLSLYELLVESQLDESALDFMSFVLQRQVVLVGDVVRLVISDEFANTASQVKNPSCHRCDLNVESATVEDQQLRHTTSRGRGQITVHRAEGLDC